MSDLVFQVALVVVAVLAGQLLAGYVLSRRARADRRDARERNRR